MKKKHVVLAAATLSLALTMGAYKSYADAATKKNAKAATESTLTNTEGATQIAASGDSIADAHRFALLTDCHDIVLSAL